MELVPSPLRGFPPVVAVPLAVVMWALLVPVLVMLSPLWLYFLPTIIAARRHHPQEAPVFALNLFLGWTIVGWVVALAMSVSYIDDEVALAMSEGYIDDEDAYDENEQEEEEECSAAERLRELKALLAEGLITKEQFDERQRAILDEL